MLFAAHAQTQADVVDYIGGQDADVDSALKQFQEMAAKYRYMEISLLQKKKSLDVKIPDIKKTLAMVKHLRDSNEENELDEEGEEKNTKTLFELHDTLYAEAELEKTDVVYLWLGVGVIYGQSAYSDAPNRRPIRCLVIKYQKLSLY